MVNNASIMNDRLWELEVDVNLVSEFFRRHILELYQRDPFIHIEYEI